MWKVAVCRSLALAALASASLALGLSSASASGPSAVTVPPTVAASAWQNTYVGTAPANTFANSNGVSCVTSAFCVGVGSQNPSAVGETLVQRWNGSTWVTVPSPNYPGNAFTGMNAVSCVSTMFCAAVGNTALTNSSPDAPAAMTYDGSGWTLQTVPLQPGGDGDTVLNSVSCLSSSWCIAAGSYTQSSTRHPFLEMWNGTAWSVMQAADPGNGELTGISCTATTFCAAVGDSVGTTSLLMIRETFDGSQWNLSSSSGSLPPDANNQLNGVSCIGPSFCAAVGTATSNFADLGSYTTLTEFWNGFSWYYAASPNVGTNLENTLLGVSCFAATSCSAVGYHNLDGNSNDNANLALYWDGQQWRTATTPDLAVISPPQDTLGGVSCLSDWACVAVGSAHDSSSGLSYNVESPIARSGYRFAASDGGIFNYGAGAPFLGSLGGTRLNAPIVGIGIMPAGDGYYLAGADGGVFNYGSARFYGSAGSLHLNAPIVGMAVTPDGGGYWLVAADGGIFNYGDAQFYGSTGSLHLNKPIVGMAATPNGLGYWLVAADGGIFNYGDALFFGSTGSLTLNKPVVGMAATTAGQYYLVASDGGIFAFPTSGGPPFLGSTGSIHLNKPIVGMTTVAGGYYLSGSDGGIFAFPTTGGPPFFGSTGSIVLNKPIVGVGS